MPEETTGTTRNGPTDGAGDAVTDEPLPPAIGKRVRTLLDLDERPATFGAWAAALRTVFRDALGRSLRRSDLCRVEHSRHRARAGDETYRFQCVLDAFVLPAFVDEPVSVFSASPLSDATVTAWVTTETVDATPTDAVVSFGIARDVDECEGTATPAVAYSALCPYINAFPTRTEYEEWNNETLTGVTTALSVPDAFAVARELTEHSE